MNKKKKKKKAHNKYLSKMEQHAEEAVSLRKKFMEMLDNDDNDDDLVYSESQLQTNNEALRPSQIDNDTNVSSDQDKDTNEQDLTCEDITINTTSTSKPSDFEASQSNKEDGRKLEEVETIDNTECSSSPNGNNTRLTNECVDKNNHIRSMHCVNSASRVNDAPDNSKNDEVNIKNCEGFTDENIFSTASSTDSSTMLIVQQSKSLKNDDSDRSIIEDIADSSASLLTECGKENSPHSSTIIIQESDVKKMNFLELAANIANNRSIIKCNKKLYLRSNTFPCYIMASMDDIKDVVYEEYGEFFDLKGDPKFISRTGDSIWYKATKISNEKLEKNENNFLALKNTILNLKTNEITSPAENIFLTYYLDVTFNMQACYHPVFDSFLETASCEDEDIKMAIWEMIAFYLFPSEFKKAFFVLIGPSNTGKSVMINLIQSFFPDKFVSNVSLQDLGDTFSSGCISEALINIEADLPETTISVKSMSLIKKITGNDKFQAHKKYINPYSCKPKCKLLFASNFPLRLAKRDDAFLNRLFIIPFNAVIPKEEQNNNLLKELIKEKSAIFNSAYKTYQRLKANNFSFTHCNMPNDYTPFQENDIKELLVFQQFFDRNFIYTEKRSDFISASKIKDLFINTCSEAEREKYLPDFYHKLSNFFSKSRMSYIQPVRRGVQKIRGYCGIRFLNDTF